MWQARALARRQRQRDQASTKGGRWRYPGPSRISIRRGCVDRGQSRSDEPPRRLWAPGTVTLAPAEIDTSTPVEARETAGAAEAQQGSRIPVRAPRGRIAGPGMLPVTSTTTA